jgi:hypothetical protein
MGLVNWVCRQADLETTLAGLIDKARASPTAAGHTTRLLHPSFHADPKALIEVMTPDIYP